MSRINITHFTGNISNTFHRSSINSILHAMQCLPLEPFLTHAKNTGEDVFPLYDGKSEIFFLLPSSNYNYTLIRAALYAHHTKSNIQSWVDILSFAQAYTKECYGWYRSPINGRLIIAQNYEMLPHEEEFLADIGTIPTLAKEQKVIGV